MAHQMKQFGSFLFLLFSISNCSSIPKQELVSLPNSPHLHTIVILGTNDIHGALAPVVLQTREAKPEASVRYQSGGAVYLASIIRKMEARFAGNFLWLDAGDEFQGTIESNTAHGQPMVAFFNSMGLDAAAIGNHEFDYGSESAENPDRLSILKDRMTEAHYSFLAANILNRKTGKEQEFPNTFLSKIFVRDGIKIGVLGLSTVFTPTTTNPVNVSDLEFTDLKKATLHEAKSLRAQGAKIIIALAHAGLACGDAYTNAPWRIRKPTDRQPDCNSHEPKNEIVRLLQELPPGTVDAVVSGHTHTLVHQWVNGVPVIQGGVSGRYLNLIYITYNSETGRVQPDLGRIEGPIPVCSKVFENQGDCNGTKQAPKNGRGNLTNAYFHGEQIIADPSTELLLAPVFAKTQAIKSQVIGEALEPIDTHYDRESPLADFIADAIRAEEQTDVAIMNNGGVRAPWEKGPITYESVFRTCPFENLVVKIDVTGKQLKAILRVAESGAVGYPAVSGIKLQLIDPSSDAPVSDLDGDGRIDPWEVNRLLDAEFTAGPHEGSKIHDDQHYTLATIDFLAVGGDDYAWPMSQIPKNHFHFENTRLERDAVVDYLKKMSPIRNPEPRIHFVKTTKKTKRVRHKKHAKLKT